MTTPVKLIPPEKLSDAPFAIRLENQQRRRLEKAGSFPRRVQTSARSHAYVEAELLAYVERKVAERDGR